MQTFFTPYYILNTLAILAYPVIRLRLHNLAELKEEDTFGYTRENGILFTSLAFLYIKWRKSATNEQFLSSIFTIGKVVITVLLLLTDLEYALYYIFVCSLLTLFLRQPKYKGPSNMVKITSEDQFRELITKGQKIGQKTGQKGASGGFAGKEMWFVEFFVDWAETCGYTKPIWTEYSLRYSTDNLKFAEVNLMTIPDLAKKYNINTSAVSRQLPTLIMFEDGKEAIRFPPYDEDSKRYMKVNKYSKKEIDKYFDLKERYLATRFNAKKTPTAGSSKNAKANTKE